MKSPNVDWDNVRHTRNYGISSSVRKKHTNFNNNQMMRRAIQE